MKRSINPFHEVRTYFAKGAFVDTRSLYVFLQEEKNVLHSFKQIATEKRIASQGLIAFGRPQGDDLTVRPFVNLQGEKRGNEMDIMLRK